MSLSHTPELSKKKYRKTGTLMPISNFIVTITIQFIIKKCQIITRQIEYILIILLIVLVQKALLLLTKLLMLIS